MMGMLGSKTLSARALRQLYLTLFLRGFGARGQTKDTAPKSVRQKLFGVLAIYALFGLLTVSFKRLSVFALSTWLHGLTFFAIGLFLLTSTGETLFNRNEVDTLLHRPVSPRELLRAKAGVLVTVALWMAGALNFIGTLTGMGAPNGGVLFLPAHVASITLEILFCVGVVILTYQLCMKWFGRERLDAIMTTVQVVASIGFFVASQTLPRVMNTRGEPTNLAASDTWTLFLPPAWFAGVDDAIAGSHSVDAWLLAAFAVAVTGGVLWMAMHRLASAYEEGLRVIGDAPTARAPRGRASIASLLSRTPPISWSLGDPVARASFRLACAYLLRDREIKLRLYPGLAPALVMPVLPMFTIGFKHGVPAFFTAFSGAYLCLIPLTAINMLEYSQQWQASDVYRSAPIAGPGAIQRGVQSAVVWLLTVPMFILASMLLLAFGAHVQQLALLAPGAILLPVCAQAACIEGRGVPLSLAGDPTKQAAYTALMFGAMIGATIVAAVAAVAWSGGWYVVFIAVEAAAVAWIYTTMKKGQDRAIWSSVG